MGILHHLECRFHELIKASCSSVKEEKEQICKSKELLLDIRHVMLYQSFDYDIRDKIMVRVDAVVNYINSFVNTLKGDESNVVSHQLGLMG